MLLCTSGVHPAFTPELTGQVPKPAEARGTAGMAPSFASRSQEAALATVESKVNTPVPYHHD